jgi:hypothetical protein
MQEVFICSGGALRILMSIDRFSLAVWIISYATTFFIIGLFVRFDQR